MPTPRTIIQALVAAIAFIGSCGFCLGCYLHINAAFQAERYALGLGLIVAQAAAIIFAVTAPRRAPRA